MSTIERPVKLFRNGRNQMVRIPHEFELPGDEAVIPIALGSMLVTANEWEFARVKGLACENWLRPS